MIDSIACVPFIGTLREDTDARGHNAEELRNDGDRARCYADARVGGANEASIVADEVWAADAGKTIAILR